MSSTEEVSSRSKDARAAAAERDRGSLAAHAGLTTLYLGLVAGGLLAAQRRGRGIPERIPYSDLLLIGIAAHKLSRLITRAKVTNFLRAPFTEFERFAGHGEVEEKARGTGLRRAVGELVLCPFCMGQWASGGLTVAYVASPRLTRLAAGILAAHAVSDFLQLIYREEEQDVDHPETGARGGAP
jgi:hypothetical protein